MGPFSEGLAAVNTGNKWGYINKEGELVINDIFVEAGDFSGGDARVKKEYGTYSYYIDKQGNYINKPNKEIFNNFSEGFARIRIGDKWGFVNQNGVIAIKPEFDYVNDFSEGFAVVKVDGNYHFIDKKGENIFEKEFDVAKSFSEGFAVVEVDDDYYFINTKGENIFKKEFNIAESFSNGVASVSFKKDGHYHKGYITKKGNFYPESDKIIYLESNIYFYFKNKGNNKLALSIINE